MRVSLFLISLALSSAACSDRTEYAEQAGVTGTPGAVAEATATATAEAREIEEETERYQFSYSWPAAASALPDLADHLAEDADRMRTELEAEADRDWEEAIGQEWTPRQHSASKNWKLVADLPDYISLSGHVATYSGGAHGMSGMESLVWAKQAATAHEGVKLFASPVALEQALGKKLCAALNAQREKRRGEPVEEGSTDTFDNCPGLDEATVLVGSSNGRTFDRITVYFGPYVAGPYVEGEYELDFPVTASVLDAVRPEFADAFSVAR